jgi:hypothetical protein
MTWATWLIGMVGPLAARLLASLGVSLVSVTGLSVALGQLKALVQSNIAGGANDALLLGGLYGFWEALGMVFGTLTFIVAYKHTQGFLRLVKA